MSSSEYDNYKLQLAAGLDVLQLEIFDLVEVVAILESVYEYLCHQRNRDKADNATVTAFVLMSCVLGYTLLEAIATW
jgi:hypothetical protein